MYVCTSTLELDVKLNKKLNIRCTFVSTYSSNSAYIHFYNRSTRFVIRDNQKSGFVITFANSANFEFFYNLNLL